MALLCSLGLPGLRLYESDDPVDALYLAALAKRVTEFREDERKALAVEIVNTLSRAIK